MLNGCTWLVFAALAAPEAPPMPQVPTSQPVKIPKISPNVSPDEVTATFLKSLEANGTYDDSAKDFVIGSFEKTPPEKRKDFVNSSLAVLSKEFAAGLQANDAEQPEQAAAIFEKLSHDPDPFLAVASTNLAAAALTELEQLDRARAMLDDVFDAHAPLDRYSASAGNMLFMLGYCQVHELDYASAKATLESFLTNYPNAPERLRVTATQILTELNHRVPRKMGDVRDLMTFAKRKIGQGDTSRTVLQRQEEAVALLDGMIKEAEEQEKSNSGGGGGGEGSGRSKKGSQQPGGGARQSSLPGGSAGGESLRTTRAKPGEAWGKMPPREREQIIQTLQQQFPSQYRELLEQYYKQLAKDAAAP